MWVNVSSQTDSKPVYAKQHVLLNSYALILDKYLCLFVNFRVVFINYLKTNGRLLYLKNQFVPRSKHFISVIKTNPFMV